MASNAQQMAEDLLHLEINTILVNGITSRKMPPAEQTLREIADKYIGFLTRTDAATKETLGTAGDKPESTFFDNAIQTELETEPESLTPAKLVQGIGQWAHSLIKTRNLAREQGIVFNLEISNILHRIAKNCDPLKEMMDSKTGQLKKPLAPTQVLSLRKIWEVGTERVLMQTVVQLDGDIVTRIQAGRESSKYAQLHKMHSNLVHLSLDNWRFMVQTLVGLLKSALNVFRN